MPSRRLHAALLALALSAPAPAAASSGGVAVPSVPPVPGSGSSSTDAGGSVAGRSESSATSKLSVASFALNGSRFYEHGRPLRVSFELSGRGSAKLKLVFVRDRARVKVVDLGDRAAGTRHSVAVPLDGLAGTIDVRVSGRDSRRRTIKAASTRSIDVRSHRFPVVGPHTFGAEGSRFGAERDGGRRKHQGQDVSAAEGTPLVAARGGVVVFTGDQPSGAGIYAVIRGAGESRDYVYMHLVEGSLLVRRGQTVRTGQLIGKVGQTGASQGPHLHFEIWQGAWQGGGSPIDPLPLLQRWDAWS
ncbi:MAG: M23 family metallopeptidase [Actinomycetota bacterium]|nr:M23 family metallopeptidase [Actinomycetota bacterium]